MKNKNNHSVWIWIMAAGIWILPVNGIAQVYPLVSPEEVMPLNTEVTSVVHNGVQALRVVGTTPGHQMAIVKGTDFKDGIIEVELAGQPLAGSDPSFRGFVGLAFRVQAGDSLRYECFYLRPTNGRADDQLRRNHSTQYISEPGYPWYVLRRDHPGVYESYVDLVPGEWTKVRIVVSGREARLFVHNVSQPALIVKDLKQDAAPGAVALWIGLGTEAFFANLRLSPLPH